MQFLERNKAAILIHFFLLADNFSETFERAPINQAREDALGIYNRFFSLGAQDPLGTNDATRNAVTLNISGNLEALQHCFDEPNHLVYTALRKYFFPRFKESEELSSYLSGSKKPHCTE